MYVILGVSGHSGSVVADALMSRKRPVRAVVRAVEKGAAWKARGAQVAVADINDAAALEAAFQGATGVYALLPTDLRATDLPARAQRITEALATAIDAAKVPHVVFLSAIGAQQADGTGPSKILRQSEQRLGGLKARLTSVRAAYFMENWLALVPIARQSGVLPTPLRPDRKIPMVATRDVGTVAAGALLEPPAGRRKIVELAGPVEHSPADVASALSRLLGKTVQAAPIDLADFKKALLGLGASAELADDLAEMNDGINAGRVVWEGGAATQVRGTTDLAAVLAGAITGAGANPGAIKR